MDTKQDIEILDTLSLIESFCQVAELAGVSLDQNDFIVDKRPAPHVPPTKLPDGKSAVYIFIFKGQTLKVGKAGPNSNARYTSQHYNAEGAKSNLAKSLVDHGNLIGLTLSKDEAGSWVRANTDRINFLLDAKYNKFVIPLLESFLQCKLEPVYEGVMKKK